MIQIARAEIHRPSIRSCRAVVIPTDRTAFFHHQDAMILTVLNAVLEVIQGEEEAIAAVVEEEEEEGVVGNN